MSIKKPYVELVELLRNNENKKVSTIMSQVYALVESQKRDTTVKYDEDGNVTHIFCYYHKVWENVTKHEYGKKKHAKSGLNTMCKVGVNMWSKQQRVFKQESAKLLDDMLNGRIEHEAAQLKQAELESARTAIVE